MASNNETALPTLNTIIISVYSISIPISIIGIVGNCIVVLAYIKYPQLRKDGPKLIGELATGDMFLEIGYLIATISRIVMHSHYDMNSFTKFTCVTLGALVAPGSYISQLYTLLLAFDRYKAMSNPIEYFKNSAKIQHPFRKFIFVSIFAMLSTAVFYFGVDLSSKSEFCAVGPSVHKFVLVYFTLFMLTVGLSVIYYYVKAVISLKYLKKSTVNLGTEANRKRARIEIKITESVVIILVAYILVWVLPNIVTLFLVGFGLVEKYFKIPYLSVLGSVNSAINILVYSTKSSTIRPYLAAIVKCKKANAVTAGTM